MRAWLRNPRGVPVWTVLVPVMLCLFIGAARIGTDRRVCVNPDPATAGRRNAGINTPIEVVRYRPIVKCDGGKGDLLLYGREFLHVEQIMGGADAEAADLNVVGVKK